jgi:hypothetical protein
MSNLKIGVDGWEQLYRQTLRHKTGLHPPPLPFLYIIVKDRLFQSKFVSEYNKHYTHHLHYIAIHSRIIQLCFLFCV